MTAHALILARRLALALSGGCGGLMLAAGLANLATGGRFGLGGLFVTTWAAACVAAWVLPSPRS